MPCYRCGTRQVDPDRGSSPWLRGVLADRQVLICPVCQSAGEWVADLDRCQVCASIRLVRRLGEVECRECGNVGEPAAADSVSDIGAIGGLTAPGAAELGASSAELSAGPAEVAPGLAEEVERALAKVLRRTTRTAPIG